MPEINGSKVNERPLKQAPQAASTVAVRGPGAALTLSWDYENQYGADRSPSGRKDWGPLDVPNTDRILEILDEYDVKATFACVGKTAEPGSPEYSSPGQIRRIHALGHEIASHSYDHDYLPPLPPRALRETMRRSRAVLEDCIGDQVATFVPPFNEPTTCLRTWCLSMRGLTRNVFRQFNTTDTIAKALAETGYEVYRAPDWRKVATLYHAATGKVWPRPVWPMRMHGITCIALNGVRCFSAKTLQVVHRTAETGGLCVAYAHPHSLTDPSQEPYQSEQALRVLLDLAYRLRSEGRLAILTAREAARVVRAGHRRGRRPFEPSCRDTCPRKAADD